MVGAYMGPVAFEGDQVRRRFVLGMLLATSAALVLAPLNVLP